jgi:hypothetical protein
MWHPAHRASPRSVRAWLAGSLVLLALPVSATAQSNGGAVPIQDLRFGTLTPGSPTVVSVADAGRAAIEVSGRGQVTVSFQLPTQLQTPQGGLLPVSFGATDGRVQIAGDATIYDFDPRLPYTFKLTGSGGYATVFLGGTALPAWDQRPGEYEGEVTLTVVLSNANT